VARRNEREIQILIRFLQKASAPTIMSKWMLRRVTPSLCFLPLARNVVPRLGPNSLLARTVQTTADTTQLHEAPSDPSMPFKLKLHEESFRTYQCEPPSLEVEVTKDQLLGIYKQMTTMRRMEMAADALYKAKLIRGFCHLAIGQVRFIIFILAFIFLTSMSAGSGLGWPGTWYQT
jgi:hypothetical protein